VAAPAISTELDPPWHRDDLSPTQQAFFSRVAAGSSADAVALFRPDFERYIEKIAPRDDDDVALARRLIDQLHPLDAVLVGAFPPSDIAEAAREALARTDGYLRDVAATFRNWEFRPEQVECPTWLWYGELDPNAPQRNGRWLAEHVRNATLVVRENTAHLGTLIEHWDEIFTTLRDVM
jgi:pimeloyl-ACP methyl ester carboxylesterase